MSLPEPDQVLVARDVDVEPLLRSVRAEIAQLSLAVRSANHEADELEAQLAEDDTSPQDLLRTSLDELMETRRHELEQALEQDLVRAAALVGEAQEDAARARLEATAEPVASLPVASHDLDRQPTAPRRLQVVESVREWGAHDEAEERPDAPPLIEDRPARAPADDALADDDAPTDDVPADEASADAGAPEPASELAPPPRPSGDVPTDPVLLGELVSAAVTAAVSQAVSVALPAAAAYPAYPVGPPWPHQLTGVHPAAPAATPRQPLRRALFHLDVVLPLLAVLIVFVVLLAWVG